MVTMLSFSCSVRNDKPAGKDGWLKGNKHEKLDTIAKQLRGFDMANGGDRLQVSGALLGRT